MVRYCAIALVIFAATAGGALAQTSAPAQTPALADPETTIARLDTDGDGGASREEWLAAGNHDAGFTLIDADEDGRVRPDEIAAFRAARAADEARSSGEGDEDAGNDGR